MAHLRPALSMAIPSFHGNRLDVPRGLRSRGLLLLPQGQTRAQFVNLQTLLPLVALLPLSILPASAQQPSIFY